MTTEAASQSPLSPMILAAREKWIQRLIDTSRNNNLLYYRATKTGALDLTNAPEEAMRALLAGETVALAKLIQPDAHASVSEARRATPDTGLILTEDQVADPHEPPQPPVNLAAIALNIKRKAQSNLDEKGLETLYVAMGCAGWPAGDGGRDAEAAVLLYPAVIEMRGLDGRNAQVRISGAPQFNLALSYVLRAEFAIKLDEETLMADDDNDAATPLVPEVIFERVRAACSAAPKFTIRPRAILSNFSFAKIAMVRDLQALGPQLDAHPVIRAIAGDRAAQVNLIGERTRAQLPAPDDVPPAADFTVVDADSSQYRVIMGVSAGLSGVIQGPPGTGKSQTIVNLIAALSAAGKRVLFVAEKRAALDVVKDRLARAGLEGLALDLHGAEINQRLLMRRVAESLARIRDSSPAIDASGQHHQFSTTRQRLNEHDAGMHTVRATSGTTAFGLQGQLLRTPAAARSTTRWRGPELDALGVDVARSVEAKLDESIPVAGLVSGTSTSPWAQSAIDDGRAAQAAVDAASRLHSQALPELKTVAEKLAVAARLRPPTNLAQARVLLTLLKDAETLARSFGPEFWHYDPAAMAAALQPAEHPLKELWAQLTNARYRDAKKTAQTLHLGGAADGRGLLAEVQQAAGLLSRWRQLQLPNADSVPMAQPLTQQGARVLQSATTELGALAVAFPGEDLTAQDFPELTRRAGELADDADEALKVPSARDLSRVITALGAGRLLEEIKVTPGDPRRWRERFRHAWLQSQWERARADDPQLAAFNGRAHDQTVQEFARVDGERTRTNAGRVRRAHAERAIAAMNEHPEQAALVRREAEKKTRHLPMRKLIAQAPEVLTALFPCWLASPLSVSQLLDGTRHYFDVVLFDEASQVLQEDAVCAILRARSLVVAGDKHQLPPTTFFAAGNAEIDEGGGDEDNTDQVSGFESLLDSVQGFLEPWMLEWHYRSKDESLIAFSNQHIYQGRMVTFPGAATNGAITHVLVAPEPDSRSSEPGADEPTPAVTELPISAPNPANTEAQQSLPLPPTATPRRGRWRAGALPGPRVAATSTNSPLAEVNKTVALILEHARSHPDESLGVITMGITHAMRVQAALDEALRAAVERDPAAGAYFADGRPEPFFIKNLERVQGDERDAIILTVGYGKDAGGNLPYRFGPLNAAGGERRLNVAITRARRRLTLVSSFDDRDMDPAKSRSRGVELLRQYLAFARGGGTQVPTDDAAQHQPASPFEEDVFEALSAKGIRLIPQWGSSRFRIDFAAQHPDQPGRFVLAIECDGASYHSSGSARDRDRLRQRQLEALGWRFHRIWSTDWFMRRTDEIDRAVAAYQDAVTSAAVAPGVAGVTASAPVDDVVALSANGPPPNVVAAASAVVRPRRPATPTGLKIDEYLPEQLSALARWIRSDGLLRTDDEMVAALFTELGLKRHGARIDEVLRRAVSK